MGTTGLDVKPLGLILLRTVMKHTERIIINSGKNEDYFNVGKNPLVLQELVGP